MVARRLKERKIAEAVGISKDILHEILGMRKLQERWVPRLLTPDNKRSCETTSEQCLTLLKSNKKEFWRLSVTFDKTWIYWYTPEIKEQSKQRTFQSERRAPKKTIPSAGKVRATVFWDSKGVIFIDYLETGKTVTRLYHAELLDRFNLGLQKIQPYLAKKK